MGSGGVVFDFAPNATDIDGHAVGELCVSVSPEQRYELRCRKGLSLMARQKVENLEFLGCEEDLFPVFDQKQSLLVKNERTGLKHLVDASRRRCRGAAQKSLDAQGELLLVEGLGEVVVGAGAQPGFAIDDIAFGREE